MKYYIGLIVILLAYAVSILISDTFGLAAGGVIGK